MTKYLWLALLCVGACSSGDDFQPIQPMPVDASTTPHDARGDAGHDAPVVASAADLSLSIVGAPNPVAANGSLTYTINVINNGGLDAASLTVTQRLPEGNIAFVSAGGIGWQCANAGQVVTCTRDTLLVGQAPSIAVIVTTPNTGGTLSSSATVVSQVPDPDNTNNTATATTTVLTPADLDIAITDSPDPVAAGGAVTYAITVHNSGPGDSTGVSVLDHLASGVTFVSATGTGWSCSAVQQDVTCLKATLAAAASSAITMTVTAPGSGGTLTNAVSVSAMTPDGNQANNTASTSTTINAAADLSVAIVDTPHPVLSSGTLTYDVNVTNNGPNTASGITVTNGLPAGNVTFLNATGSGWSCSLAGQVVTCTRPTLLVGAAPSLTITLQAPSEATSLVDTATVTSTSSDLVANNNTTSVTTPVLSAADLSVGVVDSADPVTTGGALTYTVTVNNAGPSQANNVSVVSQLPSGVTFQSASGINWTCSAVGQQVTCTTPMLALGDAPAISIATTAPATDGAITETSTVSTATTDPTPGNNSVSEGTTVNAPSDLSLTLSGPTAAPASAQLTYTIGVTNLGPRDATQLTVTNRLPDGNVQFQSATGIGWACALAGQIVTCTRPTLLVGAAPSITIQITTPPTNGGLVDQASVTATTADLNTANNSATVSTNVFDSADLSLAVTETPNPVRVGTNFAYTLSVANDGPTPATAVEVDDTLPSGATFVSAAGTGWTCSNSGNDVTCTLASLNPNSSASAITIVATAPATAGTMTNTATVSSATSDPDTTNNTASTDTLANLFADLSVTITDTPDPVQGTINTGCGSNDCVTYTIPVANAGPDTATGVKVVLQLPGNGTFFNAVGSGWVCPAPQGTTITCTRAASIAAGATAPNITLVWKAPSPGGFSIVVVPTVSSTSTDPATANNTATQDTTVLP